MINPRHVSQTKHSCTVLLHWWGGGGVVGVLGIKPVTVLILGQGWGSVGDIYCGSAWHFQGNPPAKLVSPASQAGEGQ